jgi:hypothetical protein
MNDPVSSSPAFEAFLARATAQLEETDRFLMEIREVLDRINREPLRVEKASGPSQINVPRETDNTIVGRMNMFCESHANTNRRLQEAYERLKQLA